MRLGRDHHLGRRATPRETFEAIEEIAKRPRGITAILILFLAGGTVGLVAGGYVSLPHRLTLVETALADVRDKVSLLGHDMHELKLLNQQKVCLDVAEKQHASWLPCVNDPPVFPSARQP